MSRPILGQPFDKLEIIDPKAILAQRECLVGHLASSFGAGAGFGNEKTEFGGLAQRAREIRLSEICHHFPAVGAIAFILTSFEKQDRQLEMGIVIGGVQFDRPAQVSYRLKRGNCSAHLSGP